VDERCCMDVKLAFMDEKYCSWTNQNSACPSWMEAAALVDAKLPFADESYCVDVKYSCSSWMEVTAPGQTRTLLHGCEIALRG
jgi:hypothetical protein